MNRSDPYRMRARELAIADGKDPDARVGRDGERGMPGWCLYRDAARAEQVASDVKVLATDLPLQAKNYQNAPLTIFGEHDPNTISQMQNCMRVGNAVAGVICADGHVGYAHRNSRCRCRRRAFRPR